MIICKCNQCQKQIKQEDAIVLGSTNESFMFHNPIKPSIGLITVSNYKDLHFCNKDCCVDYFFKPAF